MSISSKRWLEIKLGEILLFHYGKSLPNHSRSGKGFPVYGSNGIVGHHTTAITTAETIIIGRKGSVGEVNYSAVACSPIDTTYFVDQFFGMPPRFWFYLIKSLNLGELDKATAIPGLNREDVYRVSTLLPPLNEQKRIAAKLDALLQRVDACRARLDRVPLLLKRFRQAVFTAATSGQLTEDWREGNPSLPSVITSYGEVDTAITQLPSKVLSNIELPNSWIITNFGQVVSSIRGGTTAVPQNNPTNFPVLRSSSVRPGFVDLADTKYLAEGDSKNELNFLCEGDLLFTRLSGSLEYVANCAKVRGLNGKRIQYPDRLFCAKITQPMNVDYVELVFASPLVRALIVEHAKSSAGHQRVSISDITSQPIPIPPFLEQAEIVRRVEVLFAYADRLEARYQAARTQVERLTPSLLAKAFRGELVPQDPNDEPASVLLERIKAARATTETKTRPRTAAKSEAAPIRDDAETADKPMTRTEIASEQAELFQFNPLPKAESDGANGHRHTPPDIDELDRETLLGAIREVFAGGAQLDADAAIRNIARSLGYARTGPRIQERLKNTLRVAVQRGILCNGQGEYRLDRRSIADYSQDECVTALLASIGRGWTDREDAIRAAARYLGFRRAGQALRDAFKSAINGAIRRGLLEYDREMIRKCG